MSCFANADSVKVGVVSMEELVVKSSAGTSIEKQISSERDLINSVIEDKSKEFSKRHEDLKQKKSFMSDEAYEKDLGMLQDEVRMKERDLQGRMMQLNIAQGNAITKLRQIIDGLFEKVASEVGVDLILVKEVVMYHSSDVVDVTGTVLAKLDDDTEYVKVDFDGGGSGVSNQ